MTRPTGSVQKVHRTHHIYHSDTFALSFNPERISVDQIEQGQYSIYIGDGIYRPCEMIDGRKWVTLSSMIP